MDENVKEGVESVKMDERGWKWMLIDENGWKWIKWMNMNLWNCMNMNECKWIKLMNIDKIDKID